MRFSPLSLLLTIQISTWCVLGAMVHGWQLLCYPLAWVMIFALFYAMNAAYDRKYGKTSGHHVHVADAGHEHLVPELHRHFEPAADVVTVG